MQSLKDRLKAARSMKGWSQSELARCSGVSQGAISDLETGRSSATRDIVKLAIALGVDPAWLAGGEDALRAKQHGQELMKSISQPHTCGTVTLMPTEAASFDTIMYPRNVDAQAAFIAFAYAMGLVIDELSLTDEGIQLCAHWQDVARS